MQAVFIEAPLNRLCDKRSLGLAYQKNSFCQEKSKINGHLDKDTPYPPAGGGETEMLPASRGEQRTQTHSSTDACFCRVSLCSTRPTKLWHLPPAGGGNGDIARKQGGAENTNAQFERMPASVGFRCALPDLQNFGTYPPTPPQAGGNEVGTASAGNGICAASSVLLQRELGIFGDP